MEQPKIKLLPSDPVRICKECGEGKLLTTENFCYQDTEKGTFREECKCCEAVRRAKRRVDNPYKILYQNKKKQCNKTGVEFDLTEEYLKSIAPVFCPVFPWLELKYTGGKVEDHTASIDRIDPTGGYTKGNVQIISVKANRCKSNLSAKDLQAFAKWVNKNL